jgi:hypothetical protein
MKNFPCSKWAADCNLILAKCETEYLPPFGICLSCSSTRLLRSSPVANPALNARTATQLVHAAMNLNTSIIKRQMPGGQFSLFGRPVTYECAETNVQRSTIARPLCHVERSRDISYCIVLDERHRDYNERFLDSARNDKVLAITFPPQLAFRGDYVRRRICCVSSK